MPSSSPTWTAAASPKGTRTPCHTAQTTATPQAQPHKHAPRGPLTALLLAALAILAALAAGCTAADRATLPPSGQPPAVAGLFSPGVTVIPGGTVWYPAESFFGSVVYDGTRYTAELDRVYFRTWPIEKLANGQGSGVLTLEFRDAAGQALHREPLSAGKNDYQDGTINWSFGPILSTPPDYDSYAIFKGQDEIAVVHRSPNPPSATITGVSEGQYFSHDDSIELGLELSDPDGDELTYVLYYYSEDVYEPLTGPRTDTDPGLEPFDVNWLRGSDAARFAVSVSDGTRSVFVETPLFRVQRHTPVVTLGSDTYSFVTGGRWVTIEANVTDIDGYYQDQGTAVWESDLDGVIHPGPAHNYAGENQIIELWTPNLTEGTTPSPSPPPTTPACQAPTPPSCTSYTNPTPHRRNSKPATTMWKPG